MTEYCRNCGEKLKDDALFCANCGEKVPSKRKFPNKYLILIVIVAIAIVAVASTIFLTNQTQTVRVEDVQFELPSDYVKEPSRTDVNYDGNVKSSAMGWSNDKNYIEIGVTSTPGSGINSEKLHQLLEVHQQRCLDIQDIIWNMKMRVVHLFLALRMRSA